jgi:preprotein translocase subunit YajC
VLAHHHVTFGLLAAGKSSSSNGYGTLVLFGIIILVFFAITRSQRAKQRRALDQRKAINVGVEVVTTAGLIAQVVDMDDETVTLEIAPGVHSRFLRQAVVRVVEQPGPEEPESTDGAADPADPTGDDTTPDRTG